MYQNKAENVPTVLDYNITFLVDNSQDSTLGANAQGKVKGFP